MMTPEEVERTLQSLKFRIDALESPRRALQREVGIIGKRLARVERRRGLSATENSLASSTDLRDLGDIKTFVDLEEPALTPDTPPADVLRLYAKDASGLTVLELQNSAGQKTQLGGGPALIGRSSANLTCTTAFQDVAGMTVTLVRPGTYLIQCIFAVQFDSLVANNDIDFVGELQIGGVSESPIAVLRFIPQVNTELLRAPAIQTWIVTTTSASVVAKARAKKVNNVGSAIVFSTLGGNTGLSVLTALWTGE